ncbi:MAG: restriction endonuclease subunit S [Snowella sp.]|nr:restriction endonuclease subunit S [Snowella sp.]
MKDETRQLELDMGNITIDNQNNLISSAHTENSRIKNVLLEDICEIQIGKTPSRSIPRYWGGNLPWVTISDLAEERIITRTKEKITDIAAKESGSKLIGKGTLLLSFKLSLGKRAFAGCDLFTNEAIAALQLFDENTTSKDYLYWILGSIDYDRFVDRAAKGKTLNKAKLKKLPIPLPPLEEQKRIARILDAADELRAKRRQALAELDTLLQSTFLDMFGDFPPTTPLDKECTFSQGIQIPVEKQHKKCQEGFVRFLRIIDYTQQDEPRYIPFPGDRYMVTKDDIAMVRYGASAGHVCMGKSGIIANNLFKFNFNKKKILPIYLYYCLTSQRFKNFINKNVFGAAMPALSFKIMNDYDIPLPPLELQQKFATIVEAVEQQKARMREHLAELDTLFASLQHRAFNGEL